MANNCPGDASFTIIAQAAPEFSGCYIGSTTDDGVAVYTVSGTASQSEIVVFSLEDDGGNVSRESLNDVQ